MDGLGEKRGQEGVKRRAVFAYPALFVFAMKMNRKSDGTSDSGLETKQAICRRHGPLSARNYELVLLILNGK